MENASARFTTRILRYMHDVDEPAPKKSLQCHRAQIWKAAGSKKLEALHKLNEKRFFCNPATNLGGKEAQNLEF